LAIVEYLRNGYAFDRSHGFTGELVLEDFCTHRRGGDHWFATAAAVMAKQLGFRSRLATGFYVPTVSGRSTDGNVIVGPTDVHVWPEVQLASGRWVELEPTPGYWLPVYRASFSLILKRMVSRYWRLTGVVVLAIIFLFLSRAYWLDWGFSFVWLFSGLLPVKNRLRLGLRIIDWRAALAGHGRMKGQNQRLWLESLTANNQRLAAQTKQLLDAADQTFFGTHRPALTTTNTSIVGHLRVSAIHQLHRENNS
ncbi:MAG: transglutaminase-like domain-containing protein, partial [Planctomycetota bacterium]